MRFRARWYLGMCGVALAVPVAALAAPFGDDQPGGGMPPQQAQAVKHRGGLLHRRHCVDCQRAYAKSHDGIDVPAPPPIGPAVPPAAPGAMNAHMIPGHLVDIQTGECLTCQGRVTAPGPMTGGAPGHAWAGGEMAGSPNAPGYAVVGDVPPGMGPAPIGMARAQQHPSFDTRMSGMDPRAGASHYDPAVVAASVPRPQVAVTAPAADRPHVISHLFGIPKFGRLHREQADKERQKHASITYDDANSKVTELPASMVYEKGQK